MKKRNKKITYTSQNINKINQTMSLFIVQYPGQSKLVMIIFKPINELFIQKRIPLTKKISYKIINKMFIHIQQLVLVR